MTRTAAVSARLRLVHPFPSLLNGVAVFLMASIAGGTVATAVRLGLGMLFIQFAIGTLNDLMDAPRDAARIPVKPIPARLVGVMAARRLAVGAALGGLLFASPSGPLTVVIAAVGLGLGVAYDLGLSRTSISWLPLAFALPLVPVYAWYGAIGRVPAEILAVVPVAILAGAGLAAGNALVDIDADETTGRRTVAVALGRPGAWATHAGLLLGSMVLAVVLRPSGGGLAAERLVVSGVGATLAGVALLWWARGVGRRIAWGLEAIGIATIGIGWVLGAGAIGS